MKARPFLIYRAGAHPDGIALVDGFFNILLVPPEVWRNWFVRGLIWVVGFHHQQGGLTVDYRISVAGFEGRDIQVKSAGFFSDYKLFVDGQQAPKGPKRDQMVIRRNDGVETIATWKRVVLGLDVPQLVIEDQVISVVKPLQWHEWLWSGLPIILVFTGGALGGAIGALAFALNAKIFRAEANGFLKYFLTAVVSILSVLLLLLIVFLLFGAPER